MTPALRKLHERHPCRRCNGKGYVRLSLTPGMTQCLHHGCGFRLWESHAVSQLVANSEAREFGIVPMFAGVASEHGDTSTLNQIELLSVTAPSIARPYCCYMNTVIFYVFPSVVTKHGGFLEWERVETLLRWDLRILVNGSPFKCGGGRVIRWRGHWWMRRDARRCSSLPVSSSPSLPISQ